MIEQILTEPTAMMVGWLIRGSLILTALFLLAALLRREPSSTRHLLWTAGIGVALAVPIASFWVPAWEIEVPVGTMTSTTFGSAGDVGVSGISQRPETGFDAIRSTAAPAAARTGAEAPRADLVAQTLSWFRSPAFIVPALTALWFMVALFFLIRFATSVLKTRAIVREANLASDPLWNRLRLEISDRLELARAPRLLVSRETKVPMTCGILRPAVVLPTDAADWPVDRREAVLCHELAHIERRDILSHLLGHVTCAVYWFYPLAWKAARLQRAESERACDDLVLSLGIRPSAYADHLLQIATAGHGAGTPAAALPMARPKEFEARLLSILAPGIPRGSTRGWRALAPLVLVIATAAPLVALTPSPVPSDRTALYSDEIDWPDAPDAPDETDSDTDDEVRGQVLAAVPTESRMDADGDTVQLRELERRTAQLGERVADFITDLAHDMERHGPAIVDEVASVGVAIGEAFAQAFSPAFNTATDRVMGNGHEGFGANAEASFTRSLSVSGPVELEVMTGSGHIEILEGHGDRVEVHGMIQVRERGRTRAAAEALARSIAANPPIQHEDNGVRVGDAGGLGLRWAGEDNVTISYHIMVPTRTSVGSYTGSGAQTIRGISGEVEATSGSGSIELGQIVGDVLAGTGSGNIRADGIGGAFKGNTGSGSIRLVQTRPGTVEAKTGSGAIHVEGIQGSLSTETGSGSIYVGASAVGPGDEWILRTGSGRIEIALPSDAAFDLTARTRSGSINVDHPITLRGSLSGFAPHLSSNRQREVTGSVRGGGTDIQIETGSGSIRVD